MMTVFTCLVIWLSLIAVIASPNKTKPKSPAISVHHHNVKRCDGLFWFHAPKTGSTLHMALQHICCPDSFEQLVANITTNDLVAAENLAVPLTERPFYFKANHGSYSFFRQNHTFVCKTFINIDHNTLNNDPLSHRKTTMTVGVFRDPKSRIISSFLDGEHHEGMNETDFRQFKKHFFKEGDNGNLTLRTIQRINYAQAYANHPNMIGCYVKMLNGWGCYSATLFHITPHMLQIAPYDRNARGPGYIQKVDYTRDFNQTAVDIALKRLHQFRFVGVFEEFTKSIHLAHRQLNNGNNNQSANSSSNNSGSISGGGGGSHMHSATLRSTEPSPVELYPLRTMDRGASRLLKDSVDVYDPYDSIIYAAARRMFQQQVEVYNLQ